MTSTAALGWTLGLSIATHACVRLTEMVRAGAANDWVNLGGCQTLSVLVILFVILRIYVPDGSVREALGIRALAGWQFVLSVGLGVGLYPSMAMLDREILKRFPYDAEELAQFERLATVHTISERVVFIAIAFCVLPITREIFFRGVLFEQISKSSTIRTAILATAAFFAFSFDFRTIPTELILGLALGRLRASTGTLLGPIVAEIAFWAVAAVPIAAGMNPNVDITYPTRYVVVGAVAALLALVLVDRRAAANNRSGG
jgi:membrane protease YdiL (CAAX protease family)